MASQRKFRKSLSKFADETTFHGVPQAINSESKTERCAWICMVVMAMAAAFCLTTSFFVKFFDGNIGTKGIPVDMTNVRFMQQEFPLVYCSSNWIDPFKVAEIMWNHSVGFSGIEYGLSLIPADVDLIGMLIEQLDFVMTVAGRGFALYDDDKGIYERRIAQTEFAKLQVVSIDEFIDRIATDYKFFDAIVVNTTLRYGRRCYELQANGTVNAKKPKKLKFVIRHPQQLVKRNISTRVSPIPGDLRLSETAMIHLDQNVGITQGMIEEFYIPESDLWFRERMLSSVANQLSIRVFQYEKMSHCNKTEFSGRYGSDVAQFYCEENCKVKYQELIAQDMFNCSMSHDWGALNASAYNSTSASAYNSSLVPCNLNSNWYQAERDIIESKLYVLTEDCDDDCIQTECIDYGRSITNGKQMTERQSSGENLQDALIRLGVVEVLDSFIFSRLQPVPGSKQYNTFGYRNVEYDDDDDTPFPIIFFGKCNVNVKGTATEFTSPNFPNNYDPLTECYYRFEAPAKHTVELTMISARMEYKYDRLTCFDHDPDDHKIILGTFTGCTNGIVGCKEYAYSKHRRAISTTNVIVCYFISDEEVEYQGFHLFLQAIPDDGIPSGLAVTAVKQHYYNDSVWFNHTVELNVREVIKTKEFYEQGRIVDLIDLISNIGGVISLFVGSSVLSVVHLCWFCACRKSNVVENKDSLGDSDV